MTTSQFLARYWRIPVVAMLGALIAFAGSFVTDPTYASSTRLLIHGRDATFLTSDAQDLSDQPGVVDASMAKTLAETQAGVVTSREVATIVVDKLDLDAPAPESSGFVSSVTGALGNAYRCGKAFLTHGFCDDPAPREAAIQGVQEGLTAGQLGVASGEDAGKPGSYVLEIVGTGTTPEQARAVTNAAANALVAVSQERFEADSKASVQRLAKQLKRAEAVADEAAAELARYRADHDLNEADAEPTARESAQLSTLDRAVRSAEATQSRLSGEHETAVVNAARTDVDITRIDKASTPTYPVAPKRYLYLALGLLLGGLAGFGLTWMARRHEQPAPSQPATSAPEDGTRSTVPGHEDRGVVDVRPEPVGTGSSHSGSNGRPEGSPG